MKYHALFMCFMHNKCMQIYFYAELYSIYYKNVSFCSLFVLEKKEKKGIMNTNISSDIKTTPYTFFTIYNTLKI